MQSNGLAIKIVQLLDEYVEKLGATIVTEQLCELVSEQSLQESVAALPELSPTIWTAGEGNPLAPGGSLRAEFIRDVQFLQSQRLLIFVNDENKYCEAKIENGSGF